VNLDFTGVGTRVAAAADSSSARSRASDAVRGLIADLVATDLSDDEYEMIRTTIESLRDRHGEKARRASWVEALPAEANGSVSFFTASPILGTANPIAPPLQMTVNGDTVVGSATFSIVYEGPPGHVHGGVIAAVFDELLGTVQSATERPGMTGRLQVSYRSPTPLATPVRFVGRVDRVDGRKITVSGYSEIDTPEGPRRCAEAEGLFISVDFQQVRNQLGAPAASSPAASS
jgi:acyl-coenzyme A thioesterase PaaI-like protein